MTKVQNLPPNAPKSPNSHILTLGPFGALRGPWGQYSLPKTPTHQISTKKRNF